MPPAHTLVETPVSDANHAISMIALIAAIVCLVWYSIVAIVCTLGYLQLRRHYSFPRPPAQFEPGQAPHVTIIRPVKGLEPRLYDCLASTFHQDYPIDKLQIRFCIADSNDPSVAIVKQLLEDFPTHDAQLLLEEEDEALLDGQSSLGPNPKIRNMSRAYREASADIVWIIDCNVWVAKGVCGRMVAKLEGQEDGRKNKFVHQLPIVVDIKGTTTAAESKALLSSGFDVSAHKRSTNSGSETRPEAGYKKAFSIGGGRFEESFMASSHPKFYTAINTVLVAPCIIGKSTMFRRSHLNSTTNDAGIDFFSHNICEDHLIGDILWKKQVPEERQGEKLGRHAMCFGDLAIQPMADMSVGEYWRRRIRWLRVRKFTVALATFVEPGTESFLCSFYGAFAVSTLPFFHNTLGLPQTWTTFALFWMLSVLIWCLMDRAQYLKLHSGVSIEVDDNTPFFAKPSGRDRRPFGQWLLAWLGRETLALPVWTWAVYGGARVEWRGKKFWVGWDGKVHEITVDRDTSRLREHANGSADKARSD